MITIEEPPETRACSTCMSPLTYAYVFHLGRTVAFVPVPGVDRFTVRIHTCDMKPERTWRHVQKVSPETTRRGMRRARLVAAAAAEKAKSSIEKKDTP